MKPEEIGHIHAHGLSTHSSDREEAQGIQAVFGENNSTPPVVAAKSHFGNLGAGSGTVELIASLAAIRQQKLFPVLNYETPDPACALSIVSHDDVVDAGTSVLNLNFTPQGQASALLVKA